MRTCSVKGCEKKHVARGYCKGHYSQWQRTGCPIVRPAWARFWEKVDRSAECWTWKDVPTRAGYGLISVNDRRLYAHRFAYELFHGLIPDGLVIDHLCRNTRCVNPDHLEAVTQRENCLRGVSVSAINAAKTHCIHGHSFDDDNTYMPPGSNQRMCRTCLNERRAARAAA